MFYAIYMALGVVPVYFIKHSVSCYIYYKKPLTFLPHTCTQDFLEFNSQDVTLSQDSVHGEVGGARRRAPIMDYNHPVYQLY